MNADCKQRGAAAELPVDAGFAASLLRAASSYDFARSELHGFAGVLVRHYLEQEQYTAPEPPAPAASILRSVFADERDADPALLWIAGTVWRALAGRESAAELRAAAAGLRQHRLCRDGHACCGRCLQQTCWLPRIPSGREIGSFLPPKPGYQA